MITSPHTWKVFFKEHETKDSNNQEMKSLFDQFKTTKSVASCWETAKQEKMVAFLCKAPYEEGLVLIHNLTTIGGDRLNPIALNAAVIGVGIDAFISQVDSPSLFKNNLTTFFPPPWKDIEDAASIQDLTNLAPAPSSSPNNPKIMIRNCVPIPPFAFDIISEMDLKSPMSVLQNVLVEMKKFDARAGFTRSINGVEVLMRYKDMQRPEGFDVERVAPQSA